MVLARPSPLDHLPLVVSLIVGFGVLVDPDEQHSLDMPERVDADFSVAWSTAIDWTEQGLHSTERLLDDVEPELLDHGGFGVAVAADPPRC